MSGDDGTSLLYAVLLLVLVGSALVSRRLPLGQTLKLLLSWAAIFALLFAAFGYRDELGRVFARLGAEFRPDEPVQVGESLRVRQSDDGHFWVRATVNGHPVRFLVDSGATTTAVSSATVAAAEIAPDRWSRQGMVNTANGTVLVRQVKIDRLAVGSIVREDLAAMTAPEFGDMDVLGMNFLSSLRSWTVEGRTLILNP